MPCTFLRSFCRSRMVSIVIACLPNGTQSCSSYISVVTTRGTGLALCLLQALSQFRILIVAIEGIASGGQSISWGCGAITECAANELALDGLALQRVPQDLGVRQHDSAEANEVDPIFAHRRLGNERKELLKVAVTRSDEYHFRKLRLQLSRDVQLSRDTNQRILGWQISIGRWIQSGSLNVGIVIRTSGSEIDKPNSQFLK